MELHTTLKSTNSPKHFKTDSQYILSTLFGLIRLTTLKCVKISTYKNANFIGLPVADKEHHSLDRYDKPSLYCGIAGS